MEYLDNKNSSDDNFTKLIDDLNNLIRDQNTLNSFLHTISSISNSYHRSPDFIKKIEQIIIYIFTNECFRKHMLAFCNYSDIFRNNKLILLILIKNNIYKINNHNISHIDTKFFYPEIKEKMSEQESQEIEKKLLKIDPEIFNNFEQKRNIGENDSYICKLIRNDSVQEFITYINKKNISVDSYINESIFETNLFLLEHKKTSLIEYASYFGSIQIFRYLFINKATISKSLWLYAVHGRNPELIHLLEEYDIKPDFSNFFFSPFEYVLYEAIKSHINEIAEYINNTKTVDIRLVTRNKSFACDIYKCGNYLYFPDNIDSLIQAFSGNHDIMLSSLYPYLTHLTIPAGYYHNIPFNSYIEFPLLKSVNISSSVKCIEANAFRNCKQLIDVTIPDSVEIIEGGVFQGCHCLEKISIPHSLKKLNDYTFQDCSSLKEIKMPSSIVSIGNFTFKGCKQLAEIEIPPSVESIGKRAFEDCSSLKEILIPSLVKIIGEKCFDKCISLTKLDIQSPLTIIENGTFQRCYKLKEISLPNSIQSMGSNSLRDCTSLIQIKMPDSLTSIGYGAFMNCLSLEKIIIPASVTNIGEYVFDKCSSLKSISIHSSFDLIGNNVLPSFIEIVKY